MSGTTQSELDVRDPATEPASPTVPKPPGRTTPRQQTPPPKPPEPSTITEKWGLPLAVVVIGMFMSVLDTSIVNVAIPTMQGQFGASPDDISWVATAYTLCLGIVVPTSAWLGERLGLRRMYLISLLGFSAFSALCGTAGSLNMLIVYRILQAIPGGMIPVTCLTILYKMVPPRKLGVAMGMYGLGIVFAPGVGPALGGYLVEYVNWRLIFYINVPVGIIGAVAAIFILPKFAGTKGRKFDLPGFVCIATAAFSLLLAVSEGQQWGWTGYRVLILLALSANMFALFAIVELAVEQPLLDIRALRHWPFVNSLLLIAIISTGMFAVLYYVPLFLQNGQGITPMNTGLVVLPQAMAMAVMMPFAGRIYDRIGARWPAMIGVLISLIGSYMMVGITADTTRPEMVLWTVVRAAGISMAFMPIMTVGLAALPPAIINSGSAISQIAQRVSNALGVAALGALATTQQAQLYADRSSLITSTGPNVLPQVQSMQQGGQAGLIPLWQQMQTEVMAQTYSNIFLVTTVGSAVALILTFFLKRGRPAPGGEREVVEM
ncbi:MAG TPA: DHA2 family efflux MFS transporter permease subunit [Pseudonocardia sp.]|nr:DHA2 family efflux MFS transporter permease subunit [Pseudonocardia sp.]